MVKPIDEAKPADGGYDFSDDWLEEFEEAWDFDKHSDSGASKSEAKPENVVKDESGDAKADVDVNVDVKNDESRDNSDGVGIDVEVDVDVEESAEKSASEASASKVVSAGRVIMTQTLDIAALQKHAEASQTQKEDRELNTGDPLKDAQLWQFLSLIAMRLFDDLELMIVQKHSEEACDLTKQLNRMANFLAFAGMGEQLPLIAYISNMLPVSFTDSEIGTESLRRFDPDKVPVFMEKSNEFLNCLVYLLSYLSEHGKSFDTRRFTGNLEVLYETLNATPGQPSVEAPLPVSDGINPNDLTTRTVNKLARTLEALVTESLHYVESSVFYGYSNGFSDASRSLDNAIQIAREYHIEDLERVYSKLHDTLNNMALPTLPGRDVYDDYYKICDLLETHFSKSILEKKIKHLRLLISRFVESLSTQENNREPFGTRWRNFVKSAAPFLNFEYASDSVLLEKLGALKELSQKDDITWLAETFDKLERYWKVYPESCAEAFIYLADELRAFPTEDIEAQDLEQLNHERLKVLFERKLDERPQSAYSIIKNVSEMAEEILQLLETPEKISSTKIQNMLIDVRYIHCHSLARACEIMLVLLERVPSGGEDTKVVVAESVVQAIYFTAGFMQSICSRLLQNIEHDSHSRAVTSTQVFYSELISLYTTSGQPRDGVIFFILRRLNDMLSELQLVWVNSSTPTSTEYYCSLVRKLMHLVTICELKDVRHMILNHLDEIPQQDFINTENMMMQRQCMRIIRAVEDSCPKLSISSSSNQVRLFFTKAIAALNQLLSSRNANDPERLRSEISCIETRMAVLGMTTDFPPVIASVFELHHFAYDSEISRTCVEDLLYRLIDVANNVCPDWVQPKTSDLEFVKAAMPIPMSMFQRMMESIEVIHDALKLRASEEPIAWEQVSSLYKHTRQLTSYMPYALRNVIQNAQNRCRYLKKNIFFELITDDYPPENELPTDSVRPAIAVAFSTIVDRVLEMIVDNAFTATDLSSRISVVLQPFPNEFSASIFHNGRLFTCSEIHEKLSQVNIMPAQDDNLFDLLVSSKRLALSYPPVNMIAYILPLLRQFNGHLDISDDKQGNTRFYLSFKL